MAIVANVIPHDLMALPLLSDDKNSLVIYATSGSASAFPETVPLPEQHRVLVTSAWEHVISTDIQTDPLERETPLGRAGYRARLAVPLRVMGETIGAIDLMSWQAGVYTPQDAAVARRIADHVALTLSHQRLADAYRRTAVLQERTTKLELLDGLMMAVTDAGHLYTVIDRVSDIAQKVLPHDAMLVAVLLADRTRVRFHVAKSPDSAKFPEIIETPPHLGQADWDHDLVEDLQTDPRQRTFTAATLGYRAALRVPIRVEGQVVAGVGFFSFAPAVYTMDDVLVARRVADRLALVLARERAFEETRRADEALERAERLGARVQALTAELNARAGLHRVIGKSANWRDALTQATQVAATDTTVLLLGESGTGKEVLARFVHRASARSAGPFVALNCAALPEPLLESELFGYERGAFTGAQQAKPGQIEQAAGGVLFLDEVAEMSPSAQAKFLRVLQEREFQRLGGTRTLKANVRVVAATNRDLHAAVQAGTFREDLYYRLNVFEIRIPPLRERPDDILPLSEAFLADIATSFGRPPAGISREARDGLLAYNWPGNVRELRNMLERAAILCEGGLITGQHLTFSAPAPSKPAASVQTVHEQNDADSTDLKALERATIKRALEVARYNKSVTARSLGLSRKQLYVRLRQHGLN